MRNVALALSTVAAALVVATPASAHEFTVRGDWKMGSFLVKRDGTLRGAIDAFGRPGDRDRRHDGLACVVRWPRHGLRIVFYNLGGHDACRPRYEFFSRARTQGPHWQTGKGLEIGDRQRRLRNLYPNARFHEAEPNGYWPAGWWLLRRESPFGAGGYYPGLLATVSDRHVEAFFVRYPAGGD